MVAIAQGVTVDVSNPRLAFIHQIDGKLVDPFSLSFRILDKTTDAKRVAPTEAQAAAVVNLVADKLGAGRFAATWVLAVTQTIGRYEIEWTFVSVSGGATEVARIEFEVLAGIGALLGPAYSLVSDLRDEGVSANVTDSRLQVAIVIASRIVEQATGRFFEPRVQTQRQNGRGKRALLLGDPVIGIESLRIETEPSLLPDLDVDLTFIRVFNRHLQGLTNPDDRESPKLEFIHVEDLLGVGAARFVPLSGISLRSFALPWGVHNVQVDGVFGYTEDVHNGAPWGDTPELIKHVTKLIAFRNVPTLSNTSCRNDNDRWRIIQNKVMDQEIKLSQPRKFGFRLFGDPEIDSILTMFIRPPALGAA